MLMGVPSLEAGPGVGKAFGTLPHEGVLSRMSGPDILKLCGNGQHLAAIGSWLVYTLANTMLLSDLIFDPEAPLKITMAQVRWFARSLASLSL